ncbi:outer membrane lipoprotein SlyB [Rahnella inusitata]|nr:outer membrane lipoprotein SlyB [Rahnella inusitata]
MGKKTIFGAIMAGMLLTSSFAQAAGCLKGAVVGGVAGHLKHHAVLGAVAGCAVGHHLASQAKKQQASAAK